MSTVLLKKIFLAFIALCVSYVLLRLLAEAFAGGGTAWHQGDWLINSHQVWIRRGLLGSLFLGISDLLPLNPSQVVMVFQGALLVTLAVAFCIAAQRLDVRNPLWLLILSPAFFPIIWAANFGGSLRKELIVYCAFSLLLVSAIRPNRAAALRVAAAVLFSMAVIGHEILVLLAPAFLLILVLTQPRSAGAEGPGPLVPALRSLDSALVALVVLVSVLATLFVFLFPRVADVGLICDPLVERGLHPGICEGAIATLSDDLDSVWGYGFERTPLQALQFCIVYIVITAYFAILARRSSNPRLLWILYPVQLAPFLLFYPITNDWGRWLNMHISSLVFVTFALMLAGRIELRPVRLWLVLLVAFTSLFWSPAHTWGMREWGLSAQLWKALGLL